MRFHSHLCVRGDADTENVAEKSVSIHTSAREVTPSPLHGAAMYVWFLFPPLRER